MSRKVLGLLTSIVAIVPCSASATAAASQQILFEFHGSRDNVTGGASVGDWDGDGVQDFAVAEPGNDLVATDAGAVFVISGGNGSTLQAWYGTNAADAFGSAIAMPDVDGDGKREVLVGDPYTDFSGPDYGSAFLFAGGSGALLWRFDGSSGWLGALGGPTCDLDGDGAPDVFLGERLALRVVSGLTGKLLFKLTAPAGDATSLGYSAADVGDVDGDGFDDFMVTSPKDSTLVTEAGSASIYSGKDQSQLFKLNGTTPYQHFGFMCDRIGDVDGDGVRDFAVTSQYEDFNQGDYNALVNVYSAATGRLLRILETPDPKQFNYQPVVYGTGDVNGDGIEDFVLNQVPVGTSWYPVLFSGRSLRRLYGFERQEDPGYVGGGAGDFDGDGIADLVGNAPFAPPGRVRVYGGSRLWLDVQPGFPKTGDLLQLATREGPPKSLAALALVSIDGSPTFQLLGGVGSFDPTGGYVVSGTVPPGLSGHLVKFMTFAGLRPVAWSAAESVVFQ